jgi:hypothetical protein
MYDTEARHDMCMRGKARNDLCITSKTRHLYLYDVMWNRSLFLNFKHDIVYKIKHVNKISKATSHGHIGIKR